MQKKLVTMDQKQVINTENLFQVDKQKEDLASTEQIAKMDCKDLQTFKNFVEDRMAIEIEQTKELEALISKTKKQIIKRQKERD